MNREAEQQMITAARAGDTRAWGWLYESYYATLVWVAYAVVLDLNTAEDIAQQAFVKACEGLGDLRQVHRFGPWLSRICRNEAYQYLRDRQRRDTHENRVTDTNPVTVDTDTEDEVKVAVDNLPPMYREVVVLHYYQHLDYRRIAAILGIAGHTVRGRLFRARKMIKKALQAQGYPGGAS